MESDLVSIIIPVYNCENYIEGCLDSVSHQSYHNLEIIVVNDGKHPIARYLSTPGQ